MMCRSGSETVIVAVNGLQVEFNSWMKLLFFHFTLKPSPEYTDHIIADG